MSISIVFVATATVTVLFFAASLAAQPDRGTGGPQRLGGSGSRVQGPRLERTNLLIYRTRRGEVAPVRSVSDWHKRRVEIVRGMQEVMGPLPGKEKRCPL